MDNSEKIKDLRDEIKKLESEDKLRLLPKSIIGLDFNDYRKYRMNYMATGLLYISAYFTRNGIKEIKARTNRNINIEYKTVPIGFYEIKGIPQDEIIRITDEIIEGIIDERNKIINFINKKQEIIKKRNNNEI